MVKDPDFLGIGLSKSGTAWLYDAFCRLEDFAMPPIKEFHHYDMGRAANDQPSPEHEAFLAKQLKRYRRQSDEPHFEGYEERLADYLMSGCSDEAYRQFFDYAPTRLKGDITPAYSILDRDTTAEIKRASPDLRAILIVRDPVLRAWSQFNMRARKLSKRRSTSLEEQTAPEALESYLALDYVAARSFPTRTYAAWNCFGDDLWVMDFNRLVSQPRATLAETVSWLCRKEVSVRADQVPGNRKSGAKKSAMSAAHLDILSSYFEEELRDCREVFPAISSGWKTY